MYDEQNRGNLNHSHDSNLTTETAACKSDTLHFCQSSDQLPIPTSEVHARYIQQPLRDALQEAVALAVESDMNSGKTHANAHLIHTKQSPDQISILLSHLANLLNSSAHSMQRKFIDFANRDGTKAKIATNYTELNRHNVESTDVVTTTLNSLPKVLEIIKASGKRINILAIDESESVAQFLASGTITNKSQAGEAIKEVYKQAKSTILLDAHLADKTLIFFEAFLGGELRLLKNTYTVWRDYTFSQYEGRDAGISLVLQKITEGKNLFVTCTTASQAEKLYHLLLEMGGGIISDSEILAAFTTSDNAPESEQLTEAKENPKLFLDYRVVIISPTCGTGISIEEEAATVANNQEHFHSVVAFMTRDKNAPDAYSSLQMPFRIRNVREKHIDVIRVDNIEYGAPSSEYTIREDSKKYQELREWIIAESGITDSTARELLSKLSKLHGSYEAEIDIQNAKNFHRYFEIIANKLRAKGMRETPPVAVQSVEGLKETLKQVTENIKQENDLKIITADIITEDEAADIRARMDDHKSTATASEVFALKKHRLMKAYHFEDAPPSLEAMKNYLDLDKKGVAKGRNNISLAQLSLKEVNMLATAYTSGVDAIGTFKKDAASTDAVNLKVRWNLFRLLSEIAKIEVIDGKYTIPDDHRIDKKYLLKRNQWKGRDTYLKALLNIADTWNATKPDSRLNKSILKADPTKAVRMLLETHFALSTKKVRKEAAFTVPSTQAVMDNTNSHAAKGAFNYKKLANKVSAHKIVTMKPELEMRELANGALVGGYQNHIIECLSQLPSESHGAIVDEYLKRASATHVPVNAAYAEANHYILKLSGLKKTSAQIE